MMDLTKEPVTIRDYVDADWPQVWPIVQEVVTAGDTYSYTPDWTPEEARDTWVERAPGQTVVAVVGNRILGTAKMAPNRPGRGSHVATASFMVSGAARGMGIGRLLGNEILQRAKDAGYTAMQFNAVVETNRAAVHLWQELGFRIIGTVPEAFEHATRGRVGLHIMHRYL
jgi:L-amino acid N-acyltransferase YncA